MKITNDNDFGCNILVASNVQGQLMSQKGASEFGKALLEQIQETYANVCLVNLNPTMTYYERQKENLESLGYPITLLAKIPSSMEDYETELYSLDVSQVPKDYGHIRSNSLFKDIDPEYEDEGDDDCDCYDCRESRGEV